MNKRLIQMVKVSDLLFEARQILNLYGDEATRQHEKDWAWETRRAIDDMRHKVVDHWALTDQRMPANTTPEYPPVPACLAGERIVPWKTWQLRFWDCILSDTRGPIDESIPKTMLQRWFSKDICPHCAAKIALELDVEQMF